jgi:hypothetical protein
MGSIRGKNQMSKISCYCPFKIGLYLCLYNGTQQIYKLELHLALMQAPYKSRNVEFCIINPFRHDAGHLHTLDGVRGIK